MKSQKEAVFLAVCEALGRIPVKGEKVLLSKEQTEHVRSLLLEEIKQGKVSLNKSYSEQEMKKYVSGLVANWLRKDPRLNGGVSHKTEKTQATSETSGASYEDMTLTELVSAAKSAVKTA